MISSKIKSYQKSICNCDNGMNHIILTLCILNIHEVLLNLCYWQDMSEMDRKSFLNALLSYLKFRLN